MSSGLFVNILRPPPGSQEQITQRHEQVAVALDEDSYPGVTGSALPRGIRVMYVISRLDKRGGAGRSVAELATGLHEVGVRTELAVFRRDPEGLETELEREGIPVHVLGADHLRTAIWRLRRLIRERRPDILHTTLYAADQAGRFAAWGTRTSVVSSIVIPTRDPVLLSDGTCPAWRRRLTCLLDGWTARHLTARIHAITHAMKEFAVCGLRVPPERVTVVYRGRKLDRLGVASQVRRRRVRRSLQLDDAVIVLNVGRQEHEKGQVHLIEAFARVAVTYPKAVLLIAGTPGSSTPILESRIREHGLECRVHLLGHRDDVGDLLAAADVFAFPSLFEGLGAALIEAMALETPIVASDLPAVREVTGWGEVALLVQPGSAHHLADALERVLADSRLSRALTARGRVRYSQYFTPEHEAAGLLALYRSIVTEGLGSARNAPQCPD